MGERLEDLAAIERSCWQQLERAAAQRGHPWRTMALATTDGEAGHVRSVILREVDAAARCLVFYTDVRSPKVAQLTAYPLGTLMAWSAELGWQVRLRCRFSVDHGGLAASSRWARLKLTPAAQDYLSPLPPGTALGARNGPGVAREAFALVEAQVQAIDWLELHAEGHRRAVFDDRGARWVQP
ncbi:pyridoxamine 5'-phosphate oxidase family protein [Calidifontimicrobium sp. SYSU G02091]|uniref:pyridoxamine 5'-phosphate oxidase family protein n=1 Tax=Calidifontimicrobium sp. SYSU G02091 TaxID=2926421 RepID=UPI001F535D0F|nr:pyridoxamine 5'-phosphate oxidase family protein [Calidifontimicrobium sp. SYSU G02091]MCI1190562.1 pyridoxamine 5'-phosphate oxidase family protein [Calidifontimicrobium sp. SYSU G02091]